MSGFAPAIEDYALIGDGRSAALVSRAGGIDWLCWPRFDSAACFAALLGTPAHGFWRVAPDGVGARVRRYYRPGTMVLCTEFDTDTGRVLLTDFMPLGTACQAVVRIVSGVAGSVPMRMEMRPRFGYGAVAPSVTLLADGAVRVVAGDEALVLRASVPLAGDDSATGAAFGVVPGQSVAFVLSYGPAPGAIDAEAALRETVAAWTRWRGRCTYRGDYAEAVWRSALVLKALAHVPSGGMVAAPTTSLPERLGGTRNWDYRYCWLRDAAFAVTALLELGLREEARGWCRWLPRAVGGAPERMQIMYGLGGERALAERELAFLPGYQGARPVRIGNGAAGQFQLDVYGEVIDASYRARQAGADDAAGWGLRRALANHVAQVWEQPDEGIWEVRGGRRHFTHSKVMAWVALDRAIHEAEAFGEDAPLEAWRAARARIHDAVCAHGYDARRNTFVQSFGARAVDASLLMLPLVGFLPADDPRMLGTVAAIERDLLVDGMVLRYRDDAAPDGLPPGEGAFLLCGFWLADNYILQGRLPEARALFARLLATRNEVGLLAEQFEPRARRLTGNFPQALSHAGLIGTALRLGAAG